jgi:hypothetical protein
MRKPFEQDIYDEVDGKSKEAVAGYLSSRGVVYTNTEESYGADIMALHPIWHELEHRHDYNGSFPWESIHIPYRKKRLLNGTKGFYWVINRDYTKALVIDSAHMKEKYVVEVPNKKIEKGEMFYDIPIKYAQEVSLK